MRRGPLIALIAAALAVAVVAGSLLVYDASGSNTIAPGIRVAGVPVGGLSPAAARRRLQERLVAPLNRTLIVRGGGRTWRLTPAGVGLTADVSGDVQAALDRSRGGSFLTRSVRRLTGGSVSAELPGRVSYRTAALHALVRRVSGALDAAPTEAHLSYASSGVTPVGGSPGHSVLTATLAARLRRALLDPHAPPTVSVPIRSVAPKTSPADLAARFPAIIVVDRANFKLRLFRRLRLAKTYPIAVGMQGLQTPAGLYDVQDKEVDPSWHVPNSSWAGSLAGQTIPPGPQDPIKARWMGIFNGAGIHGTDETGSIGTAGSHGCIRMLIPDVIELYPQVPLHAPVYIS